jgi:hypothetical protein
MIYSHITYRGTFHSSKLISKATSIIDDDSRHRRSLDCCLSVRGRWVALLTGQLLINGLCRVTSKRKTLCHCLPPTLITMPKYLCPHGMPAAQMASRASVPLHMHCCSLALKHHVDPWSVVTKASSYTIIEREPNRVQKSSLVSLSHATSEDYLLRHQAAKNKTCFLNGMRVNVVATSPQRWSSSPTA